MPAFFAVAFLVLPLLAAAAPHPRSTYTLTDRYVGNDFLNEWDFFSQADFTHGTVNYQTKEDAVSKGLASVEPDGTTILKVDNTTTLAPGAFRDSVRISSKKKYGLGLFIADFAAMPHGPTTWPAWWSVGDNWPNDGEIDVIEGVNEATTNQMTLHTGPGCTLDTSKANLFTGKPAQSTNCESSGANNAGCGIVDSSPTSYGHEFNVIGGGIAAHEVTTSGIKIWRFPRNAIPADITAGKPDPSTWGTPVGFFSSSTCDIQQHFKGHNLVIDTTLCGDLAGNVFPGGPAECAKAVADPSNFKFAAWKINSISVFEQ